LAKKTRIHASARTAAGAAPGPGSILALLARHPSTAAQLAAVTGADPVLIRSLAEQLAGEGRLTAESRAGEVYYCVRPAEASG
jgi:hypothetical protein